MAVVTIDALGMYETNSTYGNTCLGGVTFDNLLYDYCVNHLKNCMVDFDSASMEIMETLYKKCQAAKVVLSSEEATNVVIECEKVVEIPITREFYETLIIGHVKETIDSAND